MPEELSNEFAFDEFEQEIANTCDELGLPRRIIALVTAKVHELIQDPRRGSPFVKLHQQAQRLAYATCWPEGDGVMSIDEYQELAPGYLRETKANVVRLVLATYFDRPNPFEVAARSRRDD